MSAEDKSKKIDDTETEEDKSSQDEAETDKSKNSGENDDAKPAVNESKSSASTNDEGTDGDGETEEEEKEEVKKPAKKRPVKTDDDEDEAKEEKDSDGEEDDEDDEEKKNGVEEPEKRERKKVEKFQETSSKKETEIEIPDGKGSLFSECPRIEFHIKQRDTDQLKKLHQVLFGRVGKLEKVKENLLLFKGFDYEPESDAYIKKKQQIAKCDINNLRQFCEILDVEKKGKKEDIVTRIMDFLCDPKDSGKPVPQVPAPRPKRTSAVKANNRGFAGLDADDSDEDGRRGRTSRGRNKTKRPSYKDETSSEEDTRGGRRAAAAAGRKFSESDSEAEVSVSGSESDAPKKKKAAKKASPKKKPAGKGAGKRAPAAKRGRKKEETESEEEEKSESEDEPLQKKSKKPPTDDEIKKYVKQILEGANLEEITMKTVCKQVYGRYPDHDLTHKKDLIKTTVKSLIAS